MPNIATLLKSEISRLARKESKAEIEVLKKDYYDVLGCVGSRGHAKSISDIKSAAAQSMKSRSTTPRLSMRVLLRPSACAARRAS